MKKRTIGKVLKMLRPYRVTVGLSVIAALFSVLATLYIPIRIGNAVDRIISLGKVDFPSLLIDLVMIFCTALFRSFCQWIHDILNNDIVTHTVQNLRIRAFAHLQHLPVSFLDKNASGDILNRVIADADTFADGFLLGFSQLISGILTIVGTLVFMLTVNFWITLLVVVLTPLSLFIAKLIAGKTHAYYVAQAKSRGRETAYVYEMVGNEKVVRAYGQEKRVSAVFSGLNETLRKDSMRAVFASSLVNPTTRFVNSLVYAGVGGLGAYFTIAGSLSVGSLTCFLTYAKAYTKPFNDISSVLAELENALVSAERLFELIEETPESMGPYQMNSEMKPETDRETDCKTDCETDRGTDADSLAVEFSDVSFAYDPSEPLIEHLNLQAKPGQHIAIVGRTGCGKTTLINLLMRFYDVDGGVIRVGGTDIREMDRSDLRKRFGMVLQDTWLREGTVRENLLIGKPDATETEIERAARETRAHDFIKRLPKGYDTLITEGGGNLSQGQRQLLCITRVMLADPEMLILDEATSSVDTRTEIKIQAAFDRLMRGRTSFIVAHRLSTIRHADCIVVMDRGHVVEMGTHESLMAKKGQYYMLYESQFKGVAV